MLTKVLSVVCVLVVLSGALLAEDVVVEFEDIGIVSSNGTNRDKRTIGVVLRNVADLFGYDVQKRPTVIPPSMAPAAAPAPAPAAAPAPPAMGAMAMAPMAPPMAMNRKVPAIVPLLPPAPPLPVLPPPVTFPPILQEQVRKTFNINFNWNKSVGGAQQPVAPPKPVAAAPAPAQPPAAAPQPPPKPAAPAPAQPASVPEGPLASGPKRPVTKAQLYTEYEYLYPPLGTAPPAPKYVKKQYDYRYGPIKTVTNYNDEPEPSHDAPLNEKEEVIHDENYEDYDNRFNSNEDVLASPEAGRKEQYKNNVRNFWENNRWALHDSGYKYIAPETQQQQQQQNFQQDYPKEILTVKESNYYKPLQPLKKVKFQDYYVTQAVQPKRPAQPLPTQDISQFKKYYVQSSVPKLDLPPVQLVNQPPSTVRTHDDGRTISQADLNKIVQQLVKLTQQAKKQENAAPPATTSKPEVLSKYEEYNLPSTKEYYPSSTEVAYVSPFNPRQKKLEKEHSVVNKKAVSNKYKEEKVQPTVVEHDYNIFNTVTGNEIPYDERKFEDFKAKHGYYSPIEAEIPKPTEKDNSGEVFTKENLSNSADDSTEKQQESKSSQEEDSSSSTKEPIDDDYVANIRKPQNTQTQEHIETTTDDKARIQNVKEPIYDGYNEYEEQNDAPAPTSSQSNESAEEEDEEEKQNTAREEEDDEQDEEEAPQRQQYYHRDYDYPAPKNSRNEDTEEGDYDENSEEESRVNERVKQIISVEPKPVETDIVPKPTYQYFTFKNRKILQFDDSQEKSETQKQEKKATRTTVSPDYEDFSYKPGSTLALAEEAQATEEKEEEEEEEEIQRRPPPTFVTQRVPDYEQVKNSIKKKKSRGRARPKPAKKEENRGRLDKPQNDAPVKSPVQELREQNVFTYAPTNPFVDQASRVGQETKDAKAEKQKVKQNKKNEKDVEPVKYVELSEFLERYDDFDYLRDIERLKGEAEGEDAESSKLHPYVFKDKQNTQESRLREVRSGKAENQSEETTTEGSKYFDNYQIFKDFFRTRSDSHEEDDDDEEDKSEEETKKASPSSGLARLYHDFDYTRKPDLFAQTTTESGEHDDSKEKKESSSDNHNNFNFFTRHDKDKKDSEKADKHKEEESKKSDNPYSIATGFNISHYTDPNIPDIPDFILEEERREEEAAKLRLANAKARPGFRKVKKVRKRPGGPRSGGPQAVSIVPVNVATTNIDSRLIPSLPNAAFKPLGSKADKHRNAASSQKIETLYSGLQPNQLHELSKADKILPLTIPFDYDYSGSEIVKKIVAAQRRKREAPTTEVEAFTYVPNAYDKDFTYTIPEPVPQSYEQLEKKEHSDDEPLSEKAKVFTSEEGKLKGHIRADEDSTSF